MLTGGYLNIFYFFIAGSGTVRWQAERRAAMQTVLSYRAARWPGREPRCSLVWAGHETQEFINLFPEWTNNAEVARINKEVRTGEMSFLYAELDNYLYSKSSVMTSRRRTMI